MYYQNINSKKSRRLINAKYRHPWFYILFRRMKMKRKMIAIVSVVTILVITMSCVPLSWLEEEAPTEATEATEATEKSTQVPQKSYQVGMKGPAGGYVFYDKGSYSDGWRYMELAPDETDEGYMAWGGSGVEIKGTSLDIGKGLENTKLIVSLIGSDDKKLKDHYPAFLCDTLVYNGFDDWFLPSNGELTLIYDNLIAPGIGDFTKDVYGHHYQYWSSSVDSSGNNYVAWAYYMLGDTGTFNGSSRDYPEPHARAARRF